MFNFDRSAGGMHRRGLECLGGRGDGQENGHDVETKAGCVRLARLAENLFVSTLIFRLTEQFEIVCLPEKLLTRRDPRKVLMCHFVRFLNEYFRAVYRAFHKSLNVIKEMVSVQCATIELYMHLGGFLSTQEARVALGYRLVRLLRFFCA